MYYYATLILLKSLVLLHKYCIIFQIIVYFSIMPTPSHPPPSTLFGRDASRPYNQRSSLILSMNSSIVIDPMSPSVRLRTVTRPASASLSPSTSM